MLDSRVQLPYFVYTSVLLESFPIYVSRDRKKMDKWINEKEKKKNASWLETVKNTLKLILLSVYGNVLMIDPVKKSRKHNARAICIYLKKKKKYIYICQRSKLHGIFSTLHLEDLLERLDVLGNCVKNTEHRMRNKSIGIVSFTQSSYNKIYYYIFTRIIAR